MDLSAAELRQSITAEFERAREIPGAPYDPDRFLAFLTAHPPATGTRVADTFAAKRRHSRFMKAVQLQHRICFSWEEWERGYSLDTFAALVAAKAAKPRHYALRLARERLRTAHGSLSWEPTKWSIVFAPLLAPAIVPSRLYVKLLFLILWILLTGAVLILVLADYRYAKALVASLEHEVTE